MDARFPEADEAEMHAWVDGRLPEDRRAAVLAWMTADPRERDRYQAYARQRALLAEVGAHLGRLGASSPQAELQRRVLVVLRRQARIRAAWRAATAAAAGVALVIGGWWSLGWLERSPVAGPVVQEAMPDTPEFPFGGSLVASVGADLAAGLDGEGSRRWIADHLPAETFQLPDLEALGLRLAGGTALPETTPAVRLVYADEAGRHLFLYAGVVASKARQALTLVPEGQLSLQWRHGPLVFALVGGHDSTQLLDVMRLVNAGVTGKAPARTLELPRVAGASAEPAIRPVGMPGEPAAGAELSSARLPVTGGTAIEPRAAAPGLDGPTPAVLPVKDQPPKPL